jgi:hypothetical protein
MIITARWSTVCKVCRRSVSVGDEVGWDPKEKGVWCLDDPVVNRRGCIPGWVSRTKVRPKGAADDAAPRAQTWHEQTQGSWEPPSSSSATSAPADPEAARRYQYNSVFVKLTVPGNTLFLKALSGLEDAMIERATHPSMAIDPHMEKSWRQYNKLKERVLLAPAGDTEAHQALGWALVKVIKLMFGISKGGE